MKSKGQVSIFIIIGIVLVLLVSLGSFFMANKKAGMITTADEPVTFNAVTGTVEMNREVCIREAIEQSIDYNTLYPNEISEGILKTDIEDRLVKCMDISYLENMGYEFSTKEPTVEVDITPSVINVKGNYEIFIKDQTTSQEKTIKEFDYTYDKAKVVSLELEDGKTVRCANL